MALNWLILIVFEQNYKYEDIKYTTFSYRVWRIIKSEVFLFYRFSGWMGSMTVMIMGVCGFHRCHRLKSTGSITTPDRRQSKTFMGGSRGEGGGAGGPDPPLLKNHKNVGFLSNTGPDPLKNHKATKPEFNVGRSSARQGNVIEMAFRRRANSGNRIISPLSQKKNVIKVGPPLTKVSGSAHDINTIDERRLKIVRNRIFDCHLSSYWRQMAIE